ncbi:MAG: ATP-binding protein [Pirellula sp.]
MIAAIGAQPRIQGSRALGDVSRTNSLELPVGSSIERTRNGSPQGNTSGLVQSHWVVAASIGVALLYGFSSAVCLTFAIQGTVISPVWLASGIGLGAVLVGTYRMLPAIWIAAFFFNYWALAKNGILVRSIDIFLPIIIATGNVLEAFVGRWLGGTIYRASFLIAPVRISKRTNTDEPALPHCRIWLLSDGRSVGVFVIAAFLACGLCAMIGVLAHWILGVIPTRIAISQMIYTWWSGDLLGILLVVPAFVLIRSSFHARWSSLLSFRTLLIYGMIVLMCLGCFAEMSGKTIYEQILLCMLPAVMVILAFATELSGVVIGSYIITIAAILGTLSQRGPFAVQNKDESWLLLQAYIAIVTLMGFVVSALVAESTALANGLADMRDRETREEYERQLSESSRLLSETSADLQGVLATFPDLYFWLDPDGTFRRYFSTGPLHVPPEMFLNKKVQEIFPPEIASLLSDAVRRAAQSKTVVEVDYPLTSNGNEEWFEARLQQLKSGQILAIIRDITNRKQTEASLQQLLDERQHHSQLLAQRAVELSRSNSELEQFAYVASHDLREPLRMVRNFCNLLQERFSQSLEPKAKEYLGFAVDGAKRMQFMIDDLLEYSRVGKGEYRFVDVSLETVIQHAIENLRASIEESKAVFEFSNLPTISADSHRLTQLMQNLISNAIKFAGEQSPRIAIHCIQSETHWQISVCDNGIGIEPQYFDRVFMMFQRLHSHSKYPGTGVGLAICKRIVEQHGGSIWIESDVGVGSKIQFTIPICPSAA